MKTLGFIALAEVDTEPVEKCNESPAPSGFLVPFGVEKKLARIGPPAPWVLAALRKAMKRADEQ